MRFCSENGHLNSCLVILIVALILLLLIAYRVVVQVRTWWNETPEEEGKQKEDGAVINGTHKENRLEVFYEGLYVYSIRGHLLASTDRHQLAQPRDLLLAPAFWMDKRLFDD